MGNRPWLRILFLVRQPGSRESVIMMMAIVAIRGAVVNNEFRSLFNMTEAYPAFLQ